MQRQGYADIWDLPVRVFHWSLVAAFTIAFLTGGAYARWHEAAGYGVLALVAFRIVWGFVGTRHARFSDFVKPPRAVLRYSLQLIRGQNERHLGHNPVGGVMILVLIAACAAIGITGWLQNTSWFFSSDWLEALHWALAYGTLAIIPLHLLGVVASSLAHRENLVAAMISGRKPLLESAYTPQDRLAVLQDRVRAGNVLAVLAIGVVATQLLWPPVSAQFEINTRRARIAAQVEAERLAKAELARPPDAAVVVPNPPVVEDGERAYALDRAAAESAAIASPPPALPVRGKVLEFRSCPPGCGEACAKSLCLPLPDVIVVPRRTMPRPAASGSSAP